ncbi:MAG: PilN domain-containing protein [Smithellaceae bacterium]|nr:PilN domain-containing protein [Smithellaceae bacterium]
MIRINLLPYWEKEKKEDLRRQLMLLAGSAVIFLLIVSTLYIYISWSVSSLEAQFKTLDERSKALAKEVGNVEAYLKDKKELEKKLSIINELDRNRLFAVQLFMEMSSVTPVNDVWLKSVIQNGARLRLEGYARDNTAVARLMSNIESAGFLKGAELLVSRLIEIEKVSVQHFILESSIPVYFNQMAEPGKR